MYKIPFNQSGIVGKEQQYILEAVNLGKISGDGSFTKRCQELLEEMIGAPKTLLTTSCTDALELSALLLDIEPGDEVIMPSFTFVSTANAFVLRGAKPVFADIRLDTLNIDESKIEALISPRTKAIAVVHYAGVACEMDTIQALADKYNLKVVEDNAHGLLGRFKGRMLGQFGTFATQSFHETKNFSCGEGGALVINDPAYIDRAEIIREKGTDRSRFFRGQVDKYTWVDIGSSFLPSELLAAYLLGQLEKRETIQLKRKQIWEGYFDGLKDWANEAEVRLPTVPAHCEQPYHIFYFLTPTEQYRSELIEHLKSKSILAVYHYLPLHASKMGLSCGIAPDGCPRTEFASERLLRLPLYFDLSERAVAEVVTAIKSFKPSLSPAGAGCRIAATAE